TGGLIALSAPTSLFVQVDGLLQAKNNADNNGMVQFTTGLCYTLTLSGTGTIHGGQGVNASNFISDKINIAPTLHISNALAANPCPSCFPPPTPETVATSTPLRGGISFTFPADLLLGSTLGLAERVPTDVMNIRIRTANSNSKSSESYPGQSDLLGEAIITNWGATNSSVNSQSKTNSQFQAPTIAQLQAMGLSVNTGNNGILNLSKGVLLVAPEQSSTTVHTEYGDVFVKPGAVALIVADRGNVAVYDIHDFHSNDVSLQFGQKSIPLEAGLFAVFTRQNTANMDDVFTGKRIAYRQAAPIGKSNGANIFSAEFSLVSAFAEVGVLRQLLTTKNVGEKILAERLMKTATIRNLIRGMGQPYHQSKAK
ncbi:MAG: hypothetical protein K2X81_14465, partial [Candidatus Obscuribacterales bacterium]|nr:hypothetical protein [Candidatus Obscuribacterales bacterium]